MAVRLIEAALGAETEGVETTTTGVFDDELDAKVKAFQTAHSLTVDGVVGGATWPVLLGSWK
jgi:peptidoglycan hydrolase-like protein with peptidoglycan-binding domain